MRCVINQRVFLFLAVPSSVPAGSSRSPRNARLQGKKNNTYRSKGLSPKINTTLNPWGQAVVYAVHLSCRLRTSPNQPRICPGLCCWNRKPLKQPNTRGGWRTWSCPLCLLFPNFAKRECSSFTSSKGVCILQVRARAVWLHPLQDCSLC